MPNVIRLVFAECSPNFGGSQISTHEIIDHMASNRRDIKIYYAVPKNSPAYRAAIQNKIPAHVIITGEHAYPGLMSPIWIAKYSWRILKFIRQEKIEIVHCTNETLLWWLVPCLLSGVRPVWNVRSLMPYSFKGWLRQHIYLLFCRNIIYVSNAARRSVKRLGLTGKINEAVIPNFLPQSLENHDPITARQTGRVVIGFIGRIDDKVKNARRALRIAINTLIKNSISSEFIFRGPASTKFISTLENEIPTQLGKLIRFFPETKNISDLYEPIDILLLTSRMEGSPRVIMEAASFGIPTVAANVGGVSELIKPGETGFLFDTDDQAVDTIISLIVDPQKRFKVGLNAANYFRSSYHWLSTIEKYRHFYKGIVKSS